MKNPERLLNRSAFVDPYSPLPLAKILTRENIPPFTKQSVSVFRARAARKCYQWPQKVCRARSASVAHIFGVIMSMIAFEFLAFVVHHYFFPRNFVPLYVGWGIPLLATVVLALVPYGSIDTPQVIFLRWVIAWPGLLLLKLCKTDLIWEETELAEDFTGLTVYVVEMIKRIHQQNIPAKFVVEKLGHHRLLRCYYLFEDYHLHWWKDD